MIFGANGLIMDIFDYSKPKREAGMEWYGDDRPEPSMEFRNPRFLLKAKNRRERERRQRKKMKKKGFGLLYRPYMAPFRCTKAEEGLRVFNQVERSDRNRPEPDPFRGLARVIRATQVRSDPDLNV